MVAASAQTSFTPEDVALVQDSQGKITEDTAASNMLAQWHISNWIGTNVAHGIPRRLNTNKRTNSEREGLYKLEQTSANTKLVCTNRPNRSHQQTNTTSLTVIQRFITHMFAGYVIILLAGNTMLGNSTVVTTDNCRQC